MLMRSLCSSQGTDMACTAVSGHNHKARRPELTTTDCAIHVGCFAGRVKVQRKREEQQKREHTQGRRKERAVKMPGDQRDNQDDQMPSRTLKTREHRCSDSVLPELHRVARALPFSSVSEGKLSTRGPLDVPLLYISFTSCTPCNPVLSEDVPEGALGV